MAWTGATWTKAAHRRNRAPHPGVRAAPLPLPQAPPCPRAIRTRRAWLPRRKPPGAARRTRINRIDRTQRLRSAGPLSFRSRVRPQEVTPTANPHDDMQDNGNRQS